MIELRCAVLVFSALCLMTSNSQVVRTADPDKRGLTDTDFPRVQRLADGVYSCEQLRSAGAERFTTVSLFVVTAAGVLVADGQGSVAETRRMVEEIAKITPRPKLPRSGSRLLALGSRSTEHECRPSSKSPAPSAGVRPHQFSLTTSCPSRPPGSYDWLMSV